VILFILFMFMMHTVSTARVRLTRVCTDDREVRCAHLDCRCLECDLPPIFCGSLSSNEIAIARGWQLAAVRLARRSFHEIR
jgi:hypothetical protein